MNYQEFIDKIRSIVGSDVYVGWSFVTVAGEYAAHLDGSLTADMLRKIADVLDEVQREDDEITKMLEEVTKS